MVAALILLAWMRLWPWSRPSKPGWWRGMWCRTAGEDTDGEAAEQICAGKPARGKGKGEVEQPRVSASTTWPAVGLEVEGEVELLRTPASTTGGQELKQEEQEAVVLGPGARGQELSGRSSGAGGDAGLAARLKVGGGICGAGQSFSLHPLASCWPILQGGEGRGRVAQNPSLNHRGAGGAELGRGLHHLDSCRPGTREGEGRSRAAQRVSLHHMASWRCRPWWSSRWWRYVRWELRKSKDLGARQGEGVERRGTPGGSRWSPPGEAR